MHPLVSQKSLPNHERPFWQAKANGIRRIASLDGYAPIFAECVAIFRVLLDPPLTFLWIERGLLVAKTPSLRPDIPGGRATGGDGRRRG